PESYILPSTLSTVEFQLADLFEVQFSKKWGTSTLGIQPRRMSVLDGIPGEVVRNLEVRIKNFGKLVRDGVFVEIDPDTFELSAEQRARVARHFEE
ncbi:MAG: hypothetical protein AAF899_17615, partial [Pseudomonadota bacterium]